MNNILNKLVSSLTGKKDIIIQKKKKKEKKIKIKDGIDITPGQAKEVGYNLKQRKKHYKTRELYDWSSLDFVLYIKDLYYYKYNKNLGLNNPYCCIEIKKIQEDMRDMFLVSNNNLLKEYIDYFFDKIIDYIIANDKYFYFSYFRKIKNISKFYDHVQQGSQNAEINNNIISETKKNILNNKDMELLYFLDNIEFVCKYGIILSVNWLIFQKKLSEKDATNKIRDIYCYIYSYIKNKESLKRVRKSSDLMAPYPDWFQYKDKKFDFINSEEVNNKYSFLRR